MQSHPPTGAERGLAFIRFLEPQIGHDVFDGDAFLSDLHRVKATHVSRNGTSTTFLDAQNRIVAAWPTAQIAFISWGSAIETTMPLNEVELAEEANSRVVADISEGDHLDCVDDHASFDGDELNNDDLSVRALNALRRFGVTTWSKLLQTDLGEIANLRNVGALTVAELRVAIALRSADKGDERTPPSPDQCSPAPPSSYCGIGDDDQIGVVLQGRVLRALHRIGVTTWKQLAAADLSVVGRAPNVDAKSIRQIHVALAERAEVLRSYRPPYDVPDFSAEELQGELRDALHKIGARNRLIVIGRVTRDPPVALQALGTELGLSRERVRQLEPKAVEKLKRLISREQPAAVAKLLAQLRHIDPDSDLGGAIIASVPAGTSPAAIALIARIAGR